MKGFLFDENLPARLLFSPKLLIVPASKAGRNPTDSQIWEFARQHDLVIISKDADFSDRIITNSPPPRVVHLRFGNLRKKNSTPCSPAFGRKSKRCSKSHKLVNVYSDRLEGIR